MSDTQKTKHHLTPFFEPASIVIIGSFKEGVFGGYVVVKSLQNAGYTGKIYPVNPGYSEVLGVKVYSSIEELPEIADVALLMINARNVPMVLKECAQNAITSIILVADGFAERDAEGAQLQEEVTRMARARGLRVVGPNTAGIVNALNGFNPCPYDAGYYRFEKGVISIGSQTGMINPQAYPYASGNYGVSKICDFGNKCDLDECDFLEYMADDDPTEVVSLYLESIRNGDRFLDSCRRVVQKKPLLVLKPGVTEEGAQASASHTGSLAMDDKVFDAACHQAGVLRISNFGELFDLPRIFATQPLPPGNRLGMVSYTGAVGVVALDEGIRHGLVRAQLSEKTAQMLDEMFPNLGHVPVDIGPMIPSVKDFTTVYSRILTAVFDDENVDCLFNVLWADAMGNNLKAYVQAYEALRGNGQKPVVTWVYGPDRQGTKRVAQQVEALGFPVFEEPERCIKALGLAWRYAQKRRFANG